MSNNFTKINFGGMDAITVLYADACINEIPLVIRSSNIASDILAMTIGVLS